MGVRRLAVVAILLALVAVPAAVAMPVDGPGATPAVDPSIAWRDSRAVGQPYAGRLVDGVRLPAEGRDFFTYDWGLRRSPNRPWRRWGTDRLVRMLVSVVAGYRAAHPAAPRVGIADLSRTHGGRFGANFGGLGHASHQNGLDADVYYPRLDRTLRKPHRVAHVDRALAQDLVDRFVAAGAQFTFVGLRLGLLGPRAVVQAIPNHNDHVHVRIAKLTG